MGCDLLNYYVMRMGGVMIIVTVRYTWVGGVKKKSILSGTLLAEFSLTDVSYVLYGWSLS